MRWGGRIRRVDSAGRVNTPGASTRAGAHTCAERGSPIAWARRRALRAGEARVLRAVARALAAVAAHRGVSRALERATARARAGASLQAGGGSRTRLKWVGGSRS